MTAIRRAMVSVVSTQDEPIDIGRRLRAARILGGFETPKALADRIGEKGLGETTLRSIERGVREMEASEALVIAVACGLDPNFFYAPLRTLSGRHQMLDDVHGPDPDRPSKLDAVLAEIKDLRDDLVRSDVILPRGRAATQIAQAAAARRTGRPAQGDAVLPRRSAPGKG
jgi:transcriptional regulator with XRE-family HTH domain